MRGVVLDSSVVLAWALQDEGLRLHALGVQADLRAGRLVPIGAAPMPFELRNGLVKGARRERIAWEAIDAEIAAFERLGVPILAPPTDRHLLELCRRWGLGWADAHWADLALRYGMPLVTADRRLVRALDGTPIWVEWLGDRPLDEG